MSANSGWYPDPGGGEGLYRYWDGRAWSAATSPNPSSPPPTQVIGSPPALGHQPSAQQPYGHGTAYTGYPTTAKKKSSIGWWLGAAALLVVIVLISTLVIRGVSGSGVTGSGSGQPSQGACPEQKATSPSPAQPDGRVHGGPVSYPRLGSPWEAPQPEFRVPFGSDVQVQQVLVEPHYQPDKNWVASVLVGELQAGDGFFTPQQGAQVVVKCILGEFYDDNEVTSKEKVNKATTIDGHQAWLVESQLSFDIPNLKTTGELLIVAIVSTGSSAGLFYASIPDTTPQLVPPARDALKKLTVDR